MLKVASLACLSVGCPLASALNPQCSRSELKLLQVEARTREKLRPYLAWPTKPTEYHFCFAVWLLEQVVKAAQIPAWRDPTSSCGQLWRMATFLSLFRTRARVRAASDSNRAPWAGTSQLERLTYMTKIPDDLFDEGPLSSASSYVRSGRLLVFLLHTSPICD